MKFLFTAIYDFFRERKPLLWMVFVLVLAFSGYFASKLKMEESILQMLPAETRSEALNRFLGNSKFTDRVLIAVSQADTSLPPDADALVAATDTFGGLINSRLGTYAESVTLRTNDDEAVRMMEVMDNHLPVFLDEQDYAHLDAITSDEGIKAQVAANFHLLSGPGGFALKQSVTNDPLGMRFLAYRKLNGIRVDENVELYDGYFVTKDMRHALIFLQPAFPSSATEQNAIFFSKLDSLARNFEAQNPSAVVTWFGAPAVAAGNATQIRSDALLSVTVMVLLLVFFLSIFFRRITAPILIMVPVVTGGLIAMACIYFIQGSVSVIALGAGSLVLGIAVNYSLHFLTHNRYHQGIREAIGELAFPMTMGSLTTIGGFLCLLLVNTPVLRDLGLFAALSLAGAAVATLVFLPHFVGEPSMSNNQETETHTVGIDKFFPAKYRMALILICTPVFFYFAGDVRFETDMTHMNFMSNEMKKSEATIGRISNLYQKSIFVISSGNTLDEALKNSEALGPKLDQLKAEGVMISGTLISSLLPSASNQTKRIERWNSYWSTEKRDSVYNRLVRAGAMWHFRENAFAPFKNITENNYTPLAVADNEFMQRMLNTFIEEQDGQWTVIGIVRTVPEKTDKVYKLLEGHPGNSVFDRQQLTNKLVELVGADFNFITLWTSVMVFLALLLIYGRIELALITFIPMLVSWVWILGIMALFDIRFNMVNIVLSTFIFALGDDFCIFTTDGLQRSYTHRKRDQTSVQVSVALSALTTILGMGALLFAKHPALHSIALVSITGIGCVWFISQTLQPALFRFMITKPASKKHEPYTFFNTVKSIFAFNVFLFGSLFVSMVGVIMMKLVPMKKARKQYLFHVLISAFGGSLVRVMSNVKKKFINENGEDFSKPAVIIANHSSFLDILLMIMMHPKLILLTNKWVWNSPVFGIAVRMAEYYPVAEGAENTVPQLAAKVAEGYSIVVFPEGTRSPDGTIGRLHKGAFYLAQQLKIDILPLIIHGAQYAMTKNFFYLKNGQLTVKFLPRIHPGDPRFGDSIREQARNIGNYMREQYRLLANEIETPEYFRNRLFSNYLFKGPVLEWYMKVKVRLENDYALFDKLIPEKAVILDIGCGYGFLDYMLAYTSVERNVTGIDYDDEKISIAQNGFDRNDRLRFETADALTYLHGHQDVILLNDVLHYIDEPKQGALIDRCISNLSPGGMLIIRDGIRELAERHRGTRLSEWFSTKLLKFNKTGKQGLQFISRRLIDDAALRHKLELSVIDNTKFTSNLIFVLKQKPG